MNATVVSLHNYQLLAFWFLPFPLLVFLKKSEHEDAL